MSKTIAVFVCAAIFFIVSFAAAQKKAEEVNKPHLEAGLECESCHGTKTPEKRAPQGVCIECHSNKAESKEITFKDDKGASYTLSPHASHAGQIRCTLCHKIHTPSALYCNEGCHHNFVLKVP